MARQIKSRQRVADVGEVFTGAREVNAMLDLVAQECKRVESRFLEPACGNGNFMAEVLHRKLEVVTKRYGRDVFTWERFAFIAVTSLYGVDIMEDNVRECRERLYRIVEAQAERLFESRVEDRFLDAIRYVLEKNVICGDALTMLKTNGKPITFAEWSVVRGDRVKRRDYHLSELLSQDEPSESQKSLWDYDNEAKAWLPPSCKEYPPCDFREVMVNG